MFGKITKSREKNKTNVFVFFFQDGVISRFKRKITK